MRGLYKRTSSKQANTYKEGKWNNKALGESLKNMAARSQALELLLRLGLVDARSLSHFQFHFQMARGKRCDARCAFHPAPWLPIAAAVHGPVVT